LVVNWETGFLPDGPAEGGLMAKSVARGEGGRRWESVRGPTQLLWFDAAHEKGGTHRDRQRAGRM